MQALLLCPRSLNCCGTGSLWLWVKTLGFKRSQLESFVHLNFNDKSTVSTDDVLDNNFIVWESSNLGSNGESSDLLSLKRNTLKCEDKISTVLKTKKPSHFSVG